MVFIMKLKPLSFLLLSLSLASCSTIGDLSKIRQTYSSPQVQAQIKSVDRERVQSMEQFDTRTIYSDRIQCLGKYIAQNSSRAIDKSYLGTYAVNRDDEEKARIEVEKREKILEKKKEELRKKRLLFQEKTEIIANMKNTQQLKKTELTKQEVKKLALYTVDLKQLGLEITNLDAQIQAEEKALNTARSNVTLSSVLFKQQTLAFVKGRSMPSYSVAKIYDKTSKVYTPDSTALSELVAHALSYNPAIRYKDAPFHSYWQDSHAKIMNNNNQLSIGNLLNADRYISGALVQYDEGLPVSNSVLNSFRLSIDPVSFDKRVKVITVGLILRSVGTNNGEMLFEGYNNITPTVGNNGRAMNIGFKDFESINPSSVYIQNTFFVKQIGTSAFEIISKRNYGGSVSIETSDPKTYAIREMVERGVYELLLKSLPEKEFDERLQKEIHTGLYSKAKAECDNI